MQTNFLFNGGCLTLAALVVFISFSAGRYYQEQYILEHEKDIAVEQPGPHDGGGISVAHNFFAKAKGLKVAFRKRVLKPGSAIGYHRQPEDEIYYILSGKGKMQMNGRTFMVKAGDAILTRPGSSHGLSQTGSEDLALIISYTLK